MKPALANPARVMLVASSALVVSAVWAQATSPAFEVAAIRPADFPNPGRAGGQLDAGRLDWGFASLADMIQWLPSMPVAAEGELSEEATCKEFLQVRT